MGSRKYSKSVMLQYYVASLKADSTYNQPNSSATNDSESFWGTRTYVELLDDEQVTLDKKTRVRAEMMKAERDSRGNNWRERGDSWKAGGDSDWKGKGWE